MKAVENNEMPSPYNFQLIRTSPEYTMDIDAVHPMEHSIVESATKTAEPGLLMWDNITRNLPAHCLSRVRDQDNKPLWGNPIIGVRLM